MINMLLADRFRNIDIINEVRCPTFFVHGQQDQLIPFQHSRKLQEACSGPTAIIIPRNMDHNEFDFVDDLVQPFFNFLDQLGITTEVDEDDPTKGQIKFPERLYIPPKSFSDREGQTTQSLWSWLLSKFAV